MPPPRYYSWLQDVKIPEPPTLFDDYSGRASPAHNQKMAISKNLSLLNDLKVFPPGKYTRDFSPMSDAERAEWAKVFGPRNEAFFKANLQGDDLTRWKYQEHMKDYLRCAKSVDDSVGRLLAELKAEGLESNTVVIYSSDQGFYNGEHGWFDKRWIYEESIHMPFIIRWPGVVKPGTRFTEFIQNIDYAETFVDMAGGKIPDGLHGHSLVPVLRGETPTDWRKSVYYHWYETVGHNVPKHYGVRTDEYTLVYFYTTDEWELYDLKKDPQQLRSVYADPAYAKVVVEMKAELTRLREQFKDSDALEKAADEKTGGAKGKNAKAKKGGDPNP
jgi:arylsulfatase A-like enzyme